MIVVTAGHVDHGKTSLIGRLTGVDTDRLPEEKRRGLSIDLGFAYSPLSGGGVLGFVDVPGHDRFIPNMLAGVSSIDSALLVVAADDGPMPQTVEHLAILELVNLRGGTIALTKIDRVGSKRLEDATKSVRALVRGTVLNDAPIFPVSNATGEGVNALRTHLERLARSYVRQSDEGLFRLAVDRCFTLRGVGIVAAGAVLSGEVRVNDALVVSPRGLQVRVRSLHAQNETRESAKVGERVALNLHGQRIRKEDIRRGNWLVAPEAHNPSNRIDAQVQLLNTEARCLRNYVPVHFHIGATDVSGRVILLEESELGPGNAALAQIALARPIVAAHGDRFVLRDQSAMRTIGGGRVIDPLPQGRARRRRHPQRLALLRALETDGPARKLHAALAVSEAGLDLDWFSRALNIPDALTLRLCQDANVVRTAKPGATPCHAMQRARWNSLCRSILAGIADWHAQYPEKLGVSAQDIQRVLGTPVTEPVMQHALRTLVDTGKLRLQAGRYFLPGHQSALTHAEAALWRQIEALLRTGGTRPPVAHDIASTLRLDARTVTALLERAVELGLAHRIARTRFFLPEAVERLARVAERLAADRPDGYVEAAAYRDHSGIGRRVSVEMLEFFDRMGLTIRLQKGRKLIRSTSQIFQGRDTSPGGTHGLQNR